MGQSSSRERRRRNPYPQNPHPPHPYAPYPPYYSNPYPMPPPPPTSPPPPPPHYSTSDSLPNQLTVGFVRLLDSFMSRATTHYPPPNYAPNHGGGWWTPIPPPPLYRSAAASNPHPTVPEYVEHQIAKTVKNVVNVHKDTIRLDADNQIPGHHLVSFEFDAMADGSFTIYYFAREEINCNISPVYVDMYKPTSFPFEKGVGQKFCQPSGSGIDLSFFDLDDLLKPLNGDVFPLVIRAEASQEPLSTDQVAHSKSAVCAQITQAIIENSNNGSFQAKVMKQILWADGERYELQEIFGLVDPADAEAESSGANADDTGKECVICLSEPRNTAVLPCRHMCMCSDCAQALRLQSNKCPICRQPVEKLMEIKLKRDDH